MKRFISLLLCLSIFFVSTPVNAAYNGNPNVEIQWVGTATATNIKGQSGCTASFKYTFADGTGEMLAVTEITGFATKYPLDHLVKSYEISSYTIAANKKSATVVVNYSYSIRLIGTYYATDRFVINMTF